MRSRGCSLPLRPGCTQPAEPPARAACRTPSTPKAEVPSDPYLAEVTKFRQDREATLKGNAGWLTIAGLWFLTQPETTFGSDPLSDIVFPASAPPRAGTFEHAQRQGDREGSRWGDVSARRQAVTTAESQVRRAGTSRSLVTRERSSVLGAQQRRSPVDSPARPEQLAAQGVYRLELVSDRRRRLASRRPIRRSTSRRSSTWRAWSATATRCRFRGW